jgi:molybdopterin/thiamine biosynthesis adenylyltransferase
VIWFLNDPARVDHERRAIAALAENAPWLSRLVWRLDQSVRLCVDADVHVDETVFPVTLQYPEFYPHTPPSVSPRGQLGDRSSDHQYGPGGELCLEYGPDNWVAELTGADVLRSAYRLLAGEHVRDNAARDAVASRHQTTLGQDLRSARFRFVLTPDFAAFTRLLPPGTVVPLTVRWVRQPRSYTALVAKARPPGGPEWADDCVPPDLGFPLKGVVVRLPPSAKAPLTTSFDALSNELGGVGIDLRAWSTGQEPAPEFFLVACEDRFDLWWRWETTADEMVRFETITGSHGTTGRVSDAYRRLNVKQVAVVGCGSAGSKIAVSLARSGVSRFVLVDDDVFLSENLVRNELDWRDVGSHKADGLSARLRLVNPKVVVDARRLRLSAQEASGSAASVLEAIARCDLIIDATANPSVFNLLAAVVAATPKPLVWLEVFAGGYGGLVARYRPGFEPAPQSMRAGILEWCSQRSASWPAPVHRYEAGGAEDPPLVADDADVAVIAAHTARFAIDQLLEQTPSRFPHPIYLVGLGPGWIFNQPFETFPVDVETPATQHETKTNATDTNAGVAFVGALVQELFNESNRPA